MQAHMRAGMHACHMRAGRGLQKAHAPHANRAAPQACMHHRAPCNLTPRMQSQVLSETDSVLEALTRRLSANKKASAAGSKAKAAAAPGGGAAAEEAGSGGDEGGSAAEAWGALASRLPAEIEEQPTLLEGGSLRSYQMQVRPGAHACLGPHARVGAFAAACARLVRVRATAAAAACKCDSARWADQRSAAHTWLAHACNAFKRPQGLRWMVGLAEHGLNGILADE